MIQAALRDAAARNSLVEIYSCESDPETFDCGWVASVNSEFVCTLTLDTYGRADAVAIVRLESIFRVGLDTEYLHLLSGKAERHEFALSLAEEGASFLSFLNMARQRKDFVTLKYTLGSTVVGLVEECDSESVRIRVFDDQGRCEGSEISLMCHIRRIASGRDEEAIAALANLD